MTNPPANSLHVAVGVIQDSQGRFLVALRHSHLHQGGLWEFPGGKSEPGETVEQALKRELQEELDISVLTTSPLIKVAHDYGDKQVLLDVLKVESYQGQARGVEHQPIRWVEPEELTTMQFPAANKPIVAAARLPRHYPIIDGRPEDAQRLFKQLETVCTQGYSLAQWRVKTPQGQTDPALAQQAVALAKSKGLHLLLNASPELALETGAAGVHLTGVRLHGLTQRPLPKTLWVAASCHTLEDIRLAEALDLDFAVLSPILATQSHPDSAPLGWTQFAALANQAKLPLYALGGLSRSDLEQAITQGAQGISGIRGFA